MIRGGDCPTGIPPQYHLSVFHMLPQQSPDPWFYLVVVGVAIWIARLAIKHTVRAAVDHQFAVRIEDHKHDLQRIAEQERFKLQRDLAGASLYLEKQHAAAGRIYQGVRIAHGFIIGLFSVPHTTYKLEDCNETDVRAMMQTCGFLEGKQEELLTNWRNDRSEGIAAIRAHMLELRIPLAEKEMGATRNTIYLNEIYLSDATIDELIRFVDIADEWIEVARLTRDPGVAFTPPSKERIDDAVISVRRAFRAELSASPSLDTSGVRSEAIPRDLAALRERLR